MQVNGAAFGSRGNVPLGAYEDEAEAMAEAGKEHGRRVVPLEFHPRVGAKPSGRHATGPHTTI
jgi:hypothetical protein